MKTKIEHNTTRRSAPNQQRSRDTFEQILIAAADLIEAGGFEKLTTNMICRRAELTPPALYRYFPNKYSVLKELGERLMAQQNILMENWSLDAGDLSNLEAEIETLLFETIRVTRQTKAGAWIMRSMHATPVLAGVRVESHRHVARLLAERIVETRPDLDHGRILPSARLSVEIGYAVVEMVFDERSIDEGEILRQTASMLAFSLRQAMSHQA